MSASTLGGKFVASVRRSNCDRKRETVQKRGSYAQFTEHEGRTASVRSGYNMTDQ